MEGSMHQLRTPLFILLLAGLPFVAAAQKSLTLPGNPANSSPPQQKSPERIERYKPMPSMGMPMDGSMRFEEPLKVLQTKLNLSDSQTARVRELVESRRSRLQPIREEMKPKFKELMGQLNKPNPDPNAVGKAAIALKQVHDQAKTEQASLEKDFLNILNPDQRQTVNNLRDEAPTVLALHRLRLMSPEGGFEQATQMFER
jgi:Spy/CpxP family protein refolding chaperone